MAMVLCAVFIQAQTKTITGQVLDANGVPLPGTNIVVKNTTNGAQTDFDGNYTIDVSPGKTLVFSYVGFITKEVMVTNAATINVMLEDTVEGLDQVVIIGYGTASKKQVTTSVASIRANEIADINSPSLQSLLSSKVTGVQVTQLSGRVESGIKVRIRDLYTC